MVRRKPLMTDLKSGNGGRVLEPLGPRGGCLFGVQATMSIKTADDEKSIAVDPRTRRALSESMTVLPMGGEVYSVTTESGSEYRVDAREERCTCPDHEHRDARCKHIRRVAFATGDEVVPAEAPRDEIDDLLGEQVEGGPIYEGAIRVPVAGGVLVYRETADRIGKGLIGFEDVQSWPAIESALAARGLGRGAVYHKPVLDDSSADTDREEALKPTPEDDGRVRA
jgi:hypothetical protein